MTIIPPYLRIVTIGWWNYHLLSRNTQAKQTTRNTAVKIRRQEICPDVLDLAAGWRTIESLKACHPIGQLIDPVLATRLHDGGTGF
jgi:hypothetical protein